MAGINGRRKNMWRRVFSSNTSINIIWKHSPSLMFDTLCILILKYLILIKTFFFFLCSFCLTTMWYLAMTIKLFAGWNVTWQKKFNFVWSIKTRWPEIVQRSCLISMNMNICCYQNTEKASTCTTYDWWKFRSFMTTCALVDAV